MFAAASRQSHFAGARSEAAIAQEVQRRHANFVQFEQVDFAMLGWPDPAMAARLFVALGAEVALIELETGRNEAARQALWRFARLERDDETRKGMMPGLDGIIPFLTPTDTEKASCLFVLSLVYSFLLGKAGVLGKPAIQERVYAQTNYSYANLVFREQCLRTRYARSAFTAFQRER